MADTRQRRAFVEGEGDAWYRRSHDINLRHTYRDRLLAYLKPKDSVLEIGCSDGGNLRWLKQHIDIRGFGIDPSSEAVSEGLRIDPTLELHVGTADDLPFTQTVEFDMVWLGFFLYLVDRELLTRVVAESDRVLRNGGLLVLTDFDTGYPRRRSYRHLEGLVSFKMDYASLFLAFPHYHLIEKVPIIEAEIGFDPVRSRRVGMWVLTKDLEGAYGDEIDND